MRNASKLDLGCNGDVFSSVSKTESVICTVIIACIIVISIFGNTLVCVAIKKFTELRTKANLFLFSLALTDMLAPLTRLLFICVSLLVKKWLFGCFWCVLSVVLGNLLCASSILHLCIISLERAFAIISPLHHSERMTKRVVVILIVTTWVTSTFCSIFPYLGIGKVTFNMALMNCEVSLGHKPELSILLFMVYFTIPATIMSAGYCLTYNRVTKQLRKIAIESLGTTNQKKRVRLKKEWKALKVIIIVVGVFFLLWLPYFIINILRSYDETLLSDRLFRFVYILAYANSCCNWVIYSMRNKPFKRAFVRLLGL